MLWVQHSTGCSRMSTCYRSLPEAGECSKKLQISFQKSSRPQFWVGSGLLRVVWQAWEACMGIRVPLVGTLLSPLMTGGSKLRCKGRNMLPKRLVCSTWLRMNFGKPT